MASPHRYRILVADTAAFVRHVAMDRIAEEVWTVDEVVDEIRDASARAFVAALPYPIRRREPDDAAVALAAAAARRTGDLVSLSNTDFRILALAVSFHRELHGPDSVPDLSLLEPESDVVLNPPNSTPSNPTGWVYDSRDEQQQQQEQEEEQEEEEEEEQEQQQGGGGEEDDDDDDEAREDGEEEEENPTGEYGWITPANVGRVRKADVGGGAEGDVDSALRAQVACLTLDFAIQNVLLRLRSEEH